MPEEKEPPRPHGDKLGASAANPRNNSEDNQAQVQTDAVPDAVGGISGSEDADAREESDRDGGRGSTANGVPAFDEDDGARRRRQYKDGATLVSGLD